MILNTYHNVTISSPPSQRKDIKVDNNLNGVRETSTSQKLTRKGSRTLEPDEVIMLKRDSAKKRIEKQIETDRSVIKSEQNKPPVAYEVTFEKQPKVVKIPKPNFPPTSKDEDDQEQETNYSDDFESYESDFENSYSSQTHISSESESFTENHTDNKSIESLNNSTTDKETSIKSFSNNNKEIKETEVLQYQTTNLHSEKERKLDSGNYEINIRQIPIQTDRLIPTKPEPFQNSLDSLNETNSEQMDSGISGVAIINEFHNTNTAVFYSGYKDFNHKPKISKRGIDLKSKIRFDLMSFVFFDQKPITFENFKQIYGKLNTTQSYTQTNDNRISTECQTDSYETVSIWTQHPPQYDLLSMQKVTVVHNNEVITSNSYGKFYDDETLTNIHSTDEIDRSLRALHKLSKAKNIRYANRQKTTILNNFIDFERLNRFLLDSLLLISKILNTHDNLTDFNNHKDSIPNELSTISDGFVQLSTDFLNALRVIRVFSNARYNLIITVHETRPDADVYRSDFANLLMVWSTNMSKKPIRLLSTWCEVCHAEISNESSDIIVCGLSDGSIAMWDLRETYSFCSKLDGQLTHFTATQSVVPNWDEGSKNLQAIDLGAVIDVKSFRPQTKGIVTSNRTIEYNPLQFASLNDSGILTIWTLVETASELMDFSTMRKKVIKSNASNYAQMEFNSPWARVKLIQSAICNLQIYLEKNILKSQNPFEKTISNFQRNIYNDNALKQLKEIQADLGLCKNSIGLRFVCIDTGCEQIYICTNNNFIIACPKTLKTEYIRKIIINNSRFLFPTAICVLTNEHFLAVGLSNGSVMVLNCKPQNKYDSTEDYSKNDNSKNNETVDTPPPDIDLETGKSCAIQNIILNERRRSVKYEQEFEFRPTTAACIQMITNQMKPIEFRVYDQQILLYGSALRKNLVRSLFVSSDGWRLFALSNGNVRTYDFNMDREIQNIPNKNGHISKDLKIIDIAVAKTSSTALNLILLNESNNVEIHFLKQ
ncbi:uncharacterized protein LOC119684000 [Teleopsis dalmanni]|uniref:uncharacterized protein LOC119684000 n=1 Tax=Teleopsis dalmanni TaxID=139649 RepID=UPI0018CF81DC|nr:uncharacterized protein LOC119684000 [Teleopsis dalmanni]